MSDVSPGWNLLTAHEWLDGPGRGHGFARALRAGPCPVKWYSARALPAPYRHLRSAEGECLAEAVKVAEFDERLAIVFGFMFREEIPERGVAHIWNGTGEFHEQVVDLSTLRNDQSSGYLGAPISPLALAVLARANRLLISERIYARQQEIAPSRRPAA